jgi:hypothetical protein
VLTLSRSDYDDVFVVNVTLESLGFLSAGIHLLKEMGLLAGAPWPWSVFVNNLRVMAEIFETGSDFIASFGHASMYRTRHSSSWATSSTFSWRT